MSVILAFIFAVLLAIPALLVDGWAAMTLWGWFVVPLFSLPPLTFAYAIGLSLTVGFFTHQFIPRDDSDLGKSIAFMFCHPALAVGIGWVVKQWAMS